MKPPILDWFHIAMRMQHVAQAASGLSTDSPDRVKAKAVIVAEVERLRWRIWNGNAKNAQPGIARVRKVRHAFKGERDHRPKGASSRKLWSVLHAAERYFRGQSVGLVNYAERHRTSLRIGTSIAEGTADFLVNRRTNKAQQMRWSRRGADLLLKAKVRCAVYNVELGSGFGHRFETFPHPSRCLPSGHDPPISGPSQDIMRHTRHRDLRTMRGYVQRAGLVSESPAGLLDLRLFPPPHPQEGPKRRPTRRRYTARPRMIRHRPAGAVPRRRQRRIRRRNSAGDGPTWPASPRERNRPGSITT
ncbi:MAG TPA: hypothetical protein VME47_10660 [Acetobacteraceae bacterium]|nr:hypothetical protein [Acetobacteraceae bacterium]